MSREIARTQEPPECTIQAPTAQAGVPRLFAQTEATATRTLEFFAVTIRNPNTRRAYAHAISEFSDWCQTQGVADIRDVRPLHVARQA